MIQLCAWLSLAWAQEAREERPPPLPPSPPIQMSPAPSALIFAQVRPRLEADTGRDGDPSGGEVLYTSMRARLGAELSLDTLALRVSVNDVRVFGEETDTRRDFSADGLDVREASLIYTPAAWTLEVGRMERGLHNERLMAIANWRQGGRSFDGARVVYASGVAGVAWALEGRALMLREGDVVELGVSDQGRPGGGDAGIALLSLTVDAERLSLSPMSFLDGDGDVGRLRSTSGALATLKLGPWTLGAEGFLQVGRQGDHQLLAGLGHGEVGYATERLSLALHHTWLSGDRDPDDGRASAFNTLFGANHRYYGNIDVAMFFVGGPTDGQGLRDTQLRARHQLTQRLSLGADLHAFQAAAPLDGRLLAVEPDLFFKVALHPSLSLSGGANLWISPEPSEREAMGWLALDGQLSVKAR